MAEIFIRLGISSTRQLDRVRKIYVAHNRGVPAPTQERQRTQDAGGHYTFAAEQASRPKGASANPNLLSKLMFGVDVVAPKQRMNKAIYDALVLPPPLSPPPLKR